MTQLAAALFWVLAGLVVSQAFLVLGFLLALWRFQRKLLLDADCPPAMVVLCLRGSDPFLVRCLEAILQQDYPHFELRIVIDHPDDPARAVVDEVLDREAHADRRVERAGRSVTVQELTDRRDSCSLKCSSLVQAVNTCSDQVEFIAQLDADTIPHPSWLRELATALADPRVGAATGNRWYMPEDASLGSLIRYTWNAAAVVQMYWYRIAWGGTLAIKTSVVRQTKLIDQWSRAFCEDTMLFRQLRRHGWKVAFVPSLMMVNRESCDVGGFLNWVSRQLLTARLYHPRWPAVAAHGVGTTLVLAFTALLVPLAWLLGETQAALWLAAGFAGYQLAILLLLVPMEWLVRRIVRSRREPTRWLGMVRLLKLGGAALLTELVYPLALFRAMSLRRVDWRGVSYRIEGPWQIQLVEYQPFCRSESETVSATSL